ncbi:MAG TPA: Fic family protein [Solirubrobacteraceae bacterium]|nr:Fic family protein [Solirubrobacteraceae bacterium]
MSTLRLAQLSAQKLYGAYDVAHLQEFHRFIFKDIYPWAGELRSVPSQSQAACSPYPSTSQATRPTRSTQLAEERHLAGLSRDPFASRLTHYYAEINAVHPFREGNGRTQRAFLRQLALDAGHSLAWDRLDPEILVFASQHSLQGDNAPMRALIESVLDLHDR